MRETDTRQRGKSRRSHRAHLRLKYRRLLWSKKFDQGLFATLLPGYEKGRAGVKERGRGRRAAVAPGAVTGVRGTGVSEESGLGCDTFSLPRERKRNVMEMNCDGTCVCHIPEL